MKILKEKSREYKGTPYYKYKVNIPEVALSKSGLKAGDELEIESEKDKIILRKKIKN
jgi:bifunctional DNA-binding transcriptional regulator/antitoxin component of YhaV-PrlF toxin-antitoxin module